MTLYTNDGASSGELYINTLDKEQLGEALNAIRANMHKLHDIVCEFEMFFSNRKGA